MGEASFGKYRLIAELGHGGMADVFLAVMAGPVGSGFSKLTVIKRLRQNLAEEPEFVEMLVDEARISARLNHPNVVQTNEVGSVGNVYFLAMEYLDGQPFHRIQHRAVQFAQKAAAAAQAAAATAPSEPPPSVLLPTDPFPKECQYLVLLDTLAGLHHAHELADYDGTSLEIVHRDVTPHNVFVTYEGQVKVVDFGIAKAVGRASETRQGVVKGKVRYMAPEQAIGQPVDRRADVFSVGVMLWEAATGRRLWKDMDDLNIVQALVGGNVTASPRAIDPTVPEELDRICAKALAHNRDDRYASAEEFRLDLEQHLAEAGTLVSGRRKLGAAVTALFNDKRTEIRGVIEKQLHALNKRSLSEVKPVEIGPDSGSGSLSMPVISSGFVAVAASEGEPPTSITDASLQRRSGSGTKGSNTNDSATKSRVPMLMAGVATAVAVAALALGRISSTPAAARPSTSTSTSSAESTVPDVHVKVTTVPANAQITIDGVPVLSPYESRLARDKRDHVVRVEAPGFDPHLETIRLEGDVVMTVTLTKAVATAPGASTGGQSSGMSAAARWVPPTVPKAGPTPPTSPTPPTGGAVTPATAPPPAVPASAAPVEHKGPKPVIDKGDPWGAH
jgi:serine/threonine protein kinase